MSRRTSAKRPEGLQTNSGKNSAKKVMDQLPTAPGRSKSGATRKTPSRNASKEPPSIRTSDLGNARFLVLLFGAVLRFCYIIHQWLFWDRNRWRRDDIGKVEQLAKATVQQIYEVAEHGVSEPEKARLIQHAEKSESRQKLRAMIELAQSEVSVRLEELDRDPECLELYRREPRTRTDS